MARTKKWILASGSPRRRELLAFLCPEFEIISPEVPEWEPARANPVEVVEENARRKGSVVAAEYPGSLVIAADTTVALGERLFAKPGSPAEAVSMLHILSGQAHQVLTGVALFWKGHQHVFHECSTVRFRDLDEATIATYLNKVHVYDKAGAYAIQEEGDLIIETFEGSFENIMGFPIQRLRMELVQLDWAVPFKESLSLPIHGSIQTISGLKTQAPISRPE